MTALAWETEPLENVVCCGQHRFSTLLYVETAFCYFWKNCLEISKGVVADRGVYELRGEIFFFKSDL